MLNRTNRMLSANLNRLNLGTRSLALTGEINGKNSLRVRHAHRLHAMRAGVFRDSDPSIRSSWSRIEMTSIPGSPSVERWPVVGPVVRPPAVVENPVPPAFRTANAGCLTAGQTRQTQTGTGHCSKPSKPAADAYQAKRTTGGYLAASRATDVRTNVVAAAAATWG